MASSVHKVCEPVSVSATILTGLPHNRVLQRLDDEWEFGHIDEDAEVRGRLAGPRDMQTIQYCDLAGSYAEVAPDGCVKYHIMPCYEINFKILSSEAADALCLPIGPIAIRACQSPKSNANVR